MDPIERLEKDFKETTQDYTFISVDLTGLIYWLVRKLTGKDKRHG